jgi:hypothetical protein
MVTGNAIIETFKHTTTEGDYPIFGIYAGYSSGTASVSPNIQYGAQYRNVRPATNYPVAAAA